MALTQCPDCGKEVSTSAVACPNCGAPIAGASEAKAAGAQLTTTQATSKKIKTQQAISAIMFLVGMVWLIGTSSRIRPPW